MSDDAHAYTTYSLPDVARVERSAFSPGWIAKARFPEQRRISGLCATREEAEAVAAAYMERVARCLKRSRTLRKEQA